MPTREENIAAHIDWCRKEIESNDRMLEQMRGSFRVGRIIDGNPVDDTAEWIEKLTQQNAHMQKLVDVYEAG